MAKLGETLKSILFIGDDFVRIDIPIKYFAVKLFVETGEMDWLYWKMQYTKLDLRRIIQCQDKVSPENIMTQFNRLMRCVKSIKETGTYYGNISIGNDGKLVDGSHRLACYMYLDTPDVPFERLDRNGKYYTEEEKKELLSWFTEDEQANIIERCNIITRDLEAGRWQ